MTKVFEDSYKKLNSDQKLAVESIEGPLLVIAGPGTGKTELLSLRAANILRKTDALPENILCLTFTESGAQEMTNRLINVIGEDAYKIGVYTYHGFGSEIIRSYSNYFKNGINLRPINRLKSEVILRQLQKSLPFTSDLKDPISINNIAGIISDLKQAILLPKDLIAAAKHNLNFIESASKLTKKLTTEIQRASFKSLNNFRKLVDIKSTDDHSIESLGYLWSTELQEAIDQTLNTKKASSLSKWKLKYLTKDSDNLYIVKGEHQNKRLIELAGLYHDYQKNLSQYNLYDYDDMILMATQVMSKNSDLRYSLQEKYLYIMLDEYQDTNKAQAKLIELLTSNEVSEGRPNVMAVGDDDQAIYAFQGAKYSNMVDFQKQYIDVKQIVLKTNYRSNQKLIDLSSRVSGQISQRLVELLSIDKLFKAAKESNALISSYNFNNETEEYSWLADNIKRSNNKDIAIIVPEHKYLERASAYLIDKGIDISYERRENVLDDLLIDQLLTTLDLLQAMADKDTKNIDPLLATVLNYEFWELPTELVWQISWEAHDSHKSWLDILLEKPKTRAIVLLLIKISAGTSNTRYDQVIDQVLGLSEVDINDPKIKSKRSPYLEYYSKKKGELDVAKLFQNLLSIREEFLDFNVDNNSPLLLGRFTDFIHELKASGIKITNDFNYGSLGSKVKLLTAHAAKGLEFETVYLISFINNVWGSKKSANNRLSLPPNLQYIKKASEDNEDDKLRLLYVALTRAKNNLITLSYKQDASGKLTTPLKYLELPSKEVSNRVDNLSPLWQYETEQVEIKTPLSNLLKKRLENYSLSPTELNTFIDVRNAGPANFYKSILLKYKSPVGPRADYGSAIHSALDFMQKTLVANKKLPSLNELLVVFNNELLSHHLLSEDYKHLKQQGEIALTAYYNENQTKFSVNDLSEYNFRSEGILVNKVRVSGKIDKIAVNTKQKTIDIVDYKTGRGYSKWENKPKLHLYKNQLYFYELLVRNSNSLRSYHFNSSRLEFIEPDISTSQLFKLELVPNEEELRRFIKLIVAVNQHIKDLDFPSVKNYPANLKGIIKFEDDLIEGTI